MLLRRVLSSMIVATCVAACAGDEEPETAKQDPEDPRVAEVRENCSDFAARLCASAADCCRSTIASFSTELCTSNFIRENCVPAAAAVGAGFATYHPEAVELCLEARARAYEVCVADWEELMAIRREVWAACKTVRGTAEEGRGCSTPHTCAQPDGPATVGCLPDPATRSTTCQVLEILGEGAECPFPLNEVSVCDLGLYCTTTERDRTGICAPAVPEGQACDATVTLNPECGLGSYCGLDDGLCHRATNFGGPSCAEDTECVSFDCQMSSAGGACKEMRSTAAELCDLGVP